MTNTFIQQFFSYVSHYSSFTKRFRKLQLDLIEMFSHITKFLPSYYRMNERIWLEGLLIDWLQKSVFDKWVRRFLVHSSYLFSERVVLDFVVRFYIDYVIWPSHHYSIFDFKSVSNLLTFILILIASSLLLLNLYSLAVFIL